MIRSLITGFLFRRAASCADVQTLSIEERGNGILREQVGRLRAQVEEARRWNNQVAVRMAQVLSENGRLRCEAARETLSAEFWRAQADSVGRDFETMSRRCAELNRQLNAGGPVS